MFQAETQVNKEPTVVNLEDPEPQFILFGETPRQDDTTKVDLITEAETPVEPATNNLDNVVEFDELETLDERRRRLGRL